jgi:hypothetical protein
MCIPYDRKWDMEKEQDAQHGREIWPLCRTLLRRLDIARRILSMELRVINRQITIDPRSSSIFPGGVPFTSTLEVDMTEPIVAGVLLQHLSEAGLLVIRLLANSLTLGEKDTLMENCLTKLFPGFDNRTAHLTPLFPKAEELDWYGSEFHWTFAKSSCLKHLSLPRVSRLLAGEAQHEMNATLQSFVSMSRSSILSPDSEQHKPAN